MCEIFISADPASYESRTRSVRLHGVVTSIRLEHLYWEVLEESARRDAMTVVHLIEKLYDELVAARGGVGNFTSFLRVSALRYEALVAQGRIPADVSIPIRSLDAGGISSTGIADIAATGGNHYGLYVTGGIVRSAGTGTMPLPSLPSDSATSCSGDTVHHTACVRR